MDTADWISLMALVSTFLTGVVGLILRRIKNLSDDNHDAHREIHDKIDKVRDKIDDVWKHLVNREVK